ncbi:tetratricopeptide repeat protein [Ursidibacter arcticus]
MSLVTKAGNFLFGSSIKPNTGDKHTDNVSHRVYEEGVALLAQNDYKEALNKFRKASSLGHISAKYNLALMAFNGIGDYPDYKLSKELLIEAKKGGHQRCDMYLDFMNEVDQVMNSKDPKTPDYQTLYTKYTKNVALAFSQTVTDPIRSAGFFIYLVSRELIKMIGNDELLAKEFIKDELTAMHLGNEVSIQYVKDLGVYDPNIEVDWDSQFENRVHMYMSYNIYPAMIKFSNGEVSLEDLVYSRCCVVNEVIQAFPRVVI